MEERVWRLELIERLREKGQINETMIWKTKMRLHEKKGERRS